MRRMWTRALLLGAVGLAGGSVVGCAQERAPINQVQADALAKSFFVGADLTNAGDDPEFYMRGTIVDVGYGAAQDGLFTSTYAQPVSRIKWEVTEDLLNARLSYERIAGSDGKGNQVDGLKRKQQNDGQIVASYRIKSHFDIRRAYNSTTGEEQNVIVENGSDRPWYQREYFRVDWSQNLVTSAYDFDTMSMMGLYGGIKYEPLAYTVLDPNEADAPHFDAQSGYFDVTNKAFATPTVLDLSSLGWGIDSFPACYLPGEFAGGTNPYGNCNPTEITIRQSFRKVVDKDYEPVAYDGYRFQAFGIFTTDRVGYDRDYGMTDAAWFRFASRYNLWERSHFYADPANMKGAIACATKDTTETPTGNPNADPNRDANNNGTADECEGAGAGSRCDVFSKKCTLPYKQRKPVTIPWYINGGNTELINNLEAQHAAATTDAAKATIKAQIDAEVRKGEDLFEATNWATQEWDVAFKTAIQTSRLVECRRTGGTDCDTDFPMWTGQQDDNDEAMTIARELDACRRKAAVAGGDPLAEKSIEDRTAAWKSQSCIDQVNAAVATLSQQRGDDSANPIGAVLGLDPVVVLCHNPVQGGDHPACGEVGLSPRLGDLRYNTVLNIDKPQQPSAWGIMVDADDPLTGEKVAASINIWTHITDVASIGLVDLVKYMNGELKTSDITEGTYILNWAQAAQISGGGQGATMTKAQIDQRMAAAANMDEKKFQDAMKGQLPAEVVQAVRKFNEEKVRDVALSNDVASPGAYEVAARMRAVRGTSTEAKLINPAMLQLAGLKGNTVPAGAALDQASPLALNNPKVLSQLRQMRENAMAARGACIIHEAPEVSGLTGLADALKRKFPPSATESSSDRVKRWNSMLSYIRRRYHYAVIGHEMGHSVGHRHNFVSTSSAINYRPQYWQLRTKNGKVGTECTDAVDDGASCVGPRYFDPMTKEEQDQMIWMFMHSSIMDYPGDVSQDMIGIGAYDFAATRMFYGDVTSVYNVVKSGKLDPAWTSTGQLGQGALSVTDTFGGLAGFQYNLGSSANGTPIHYSALQKNYKLIDKCYAAEVTQPTWWDTTRDGLWDPLLDGKVVKIDGKATKCRNLPVDYMGWEQLRNPTVAEAGEYFRGAHAVDAATKRVRVPYAFASDNWADLGNTAVYRHDNGADPYEQAMYFITTQENRHIFDNYRRGRNTFNVRAAADRSFSRYNEKLLGLAGGMGFYASIYKDFATAQGYTFDSLWPYILGSSGLTANIVGGTVAFDHFIRQLSRPEAGPHYFSTVDTTDRVLHSANDAEGNAGATKLNVPNGSTGYLGINGGDIGFGGHLLENALSENHGDWDSDYTWNAGSYYEKINTAILLSESEDRFISQSRQDFYDARFRAVGLADIYPEGYRRVLANALTGDRSLLAPHVTAKNGVPEVGTTDINDPKNTQAKLYPKNPLGWTSWWPTSGPTACFSKNGSNVCTSYPDGSDGGFNPSTPDSMVAVDPQIGWEVQKFLIAWTAAYIPANQKPEWIDQLRIYRADLNNDPSFEHRIEWQDPASGQVYYAKTYGKECLFGQASGTTDADKGASCTASGGKWVQRGIAARVLEWANYLTSKGYKLDTTAFPADPNSSLSAGFNKYGRAMIVYQPDGTPVIAGDPTMKVITPSGNLGPAPVTCDNNVDATCTPLTIWSNHWAVQLAKYKEIPDYLWEVIVKYGLGTPDQLGVYPD